MIWNIFLLIYEVVLYRKLITIKGVNIWEHVVAAVQVQDLFLMGKNLLNLFIMHMEGAIRDQPLPNELKTKCQGCGEPFTLKTFVGKCPKCGGVHAVSPPRCDNPANIQFAGVGYKLPEDKD